MAGTTIHSLAYVVTANTEQFEKGMVATRQELRLSKKLMEESVPAIEKYRMAVANADSMLAKGLIDKRAHTETIGKLKTEYGQMSQSAALLASGSEKFGKAIKGYAAGAIGVFSVSKAIGAIRSEFLNIDATVKDAEKLGIAIEDLMRLRGVADMAGDASAESVDKAIAKLNMNLKDLREGSDSAIAMFEQIGITVESMQGLDLGDAFLKVADGIKNIEGADKQLAVTQEILGKGAGDLANMLKMGSNEIERMGAAIPAVNALDAEKVAKAKDAMEQIDRHLVSIAQNLAVSLAPAIQAVAESINFYFGNNKPYVPKAIDKFVAGPANAPGSEYLMREFRGTKVTAADEEGLLNLINLGARIDPNFNMLAAGKQSPAFDALTGNLYTQVQRYNAGTISVGEYESEVKQIFQKMFMELMRMREAAERQNEINQSTEAKLE